MLFVKILKFIKNIKAQDWLSASDLFMVIKYNNSERRTKVINNNNKPEWNESFLFDIKDNIIDTNIEILLYEQDNTSKLIEKYKFKILYDYITKYKIKGLFEVEIGNIYHEKNNNHNKLIKTHTDILSKYNNLLEKHNLLLTQHNTLKNTVDNIIEKNIQNLKNLSKNNKL